LLYEILVADRIVKALTDRDIAEVDTATRWMSSHASSIKDVVGVNVKVVYPRTAGYAHPPTVAALSRRREIES